MAASIHCVDEIIYMPSMYSNTLADSPTHCALWTMLHFNHLNANPKNLAFVDSLLNHILNYLAIQRSVWRDIKFAFFVCLYGWGYLNAGWCDGHEILAQGRANTRDGNEVVRGWSAHGGPWGGGLNIFGWGYSLSWIGHVIKCSPILRG